MIFKEIANISKSTFKLITAEIDVEQEYLDLHDLDEKGNPSLKVTVNKVRLSKSQTLQYILYHFLSIDQRGVIRAVSEKELALKLGCTVRTVKNNNIALEKAGLLYFSHAGKFINIMLTRHMTYSKDNPTAYLPLAFSQFEELCEIEHVNALRTQLRMILVYDNNGATRKYNKETAPSKISFNDFKIFAPKYTHYKGAVTKILKHVTKTFKTILDGNSIFFTLKEGVKDGKAIKEEKKQQYTSMIEEAIHKVAFVSETNSTNTIDYIYSSLTKKDMDDFTQLAFEYGIKRVTDAVEILVEEAFFSADAEVIRNYGAKVRTIIRMALDEKNYQQVPVGF